jgi:hypothetical protein
MDKLDIVDGFLVAWIFRDCGGRTDDPNHMAKIAAHADEVRAAVRRYLANGSGGTPKTDAGIPMPPSRTALYARTENAWKDLKIGTRKEE